MLKFYNPLDIFFSDNLGLGDSEIWRWAAQYKWGEVECTRLTQAPIELNKQTTGGGEYPPLSPFP